MTIEKLPRYDRDKNKIIKRKKLTEKQIKDTESLFKKNKSEPSLRYHQITCEKDKNRYSISVPNTSYRILVTDYGDKVIFRHLVDHDKYDKINKNC